MSQMPGIWLHGASGRMGQAIQAELVADERGKPADNFRLIGGSSRTFEGEIFYQGKAVTKELLAQTFVRDNVHTIIDFSSQAGNDLLFKAVSEFSVRNKKLLIGTTGIPDESLKEWESVAKANDLAVLIAPNSSLGIFFVLKAALSAAKALCGLDFDVEIVETHHRMKADSPSGTTLMLARNLAKSCELTVNNNRQQQRTAGEIGVHALRGGTVFGEHTIRFLGPEEEVFIGHRAYSLSLFAKGAIVLADWLRNKAAGYYEIENLQTTDFYPEKTAR